MTAPITTRESKLPAGRQLDWVRRLSPLLEALEPLLNDEGWFDKWWSPIGDVLGGSPLLELWTDAIIDRFIEVSATATGVGVCVGPLAEDLADIVGGRERDNGSALLSQAYANLRLGTEESLKKAVVLIGRADLTKNWPSPPVELSLPVDDHLEVSIPAGPDAVTVAYAWAGRLGDLRARREGGKRPLTTAVTLIDVAALRAQDRMDQLAKYPPPPPSDDASGLTLAFIADGTEFVGRRAETLRLLEAAMTAPLSDSVRGEVLIRRGWARRASGDPGWSTDIAEARRLAPDHPGLWSVPDGDIAAPAAEGDVIDTAYRRTVEILRLLHPETDDATVQMWASKMVLDLLGRLVTVDGVLSGFEADFWPIDGDTFADITGAIHPENRLSPDLPLWTAHARGLDLRSDFVRDYVAAYEKLARAAALTDGEVAPAERLFIEDLDRRLTRAVRAGGW